MTASAAATPQAIVDDATQLAREWHRSGGASHEAGSILASLVSDPAGMDFTMQFVDRVARPDDPRVAAAQLTVLARGPLPRFVSRSDKVLVKLGALAGRWFPGIVMPLAKARMRAMVGGLVADAAPRALTRHIARMRQDGYQLNLNLLGEAVLGEAEASARLQRVIDLVRRPDVDYVSVKVSALASQLITWDVEGSVRRVVGRLIPLLDAACSTGTFINLDMEEYRDVELTLEVFEEVALDDRYLRLPCGIVIQAYLPDARSGLDRVIDVAQRRAAAGGLPVKVRLVKGANLAMECVESALHGWPAATYPSKPETDANYVALIDTLLRPELAGVLRVGVAGHNLFHLALAHLLAQARGVGSMMEVEMLAGMAPEQAAAIKDATGAALLYTPIVAARDFDVAIAYLVRRMEENAAPQNFIHQMFAGGPDPLAPAERDFRASVAGAAHVSCEARRTLAQLAAAAPRDAMSSPAVFESQPDTDPATPPGRQLGLEALGHDPGPCAQGVIDSAEQLDEQIARARNAGELWRQVDTQRRARILYSIADGLQARRGRLLSVMAHEGGKTLSEADPEISEAIDFARYYAANAMETLDRPGMTFEPFGLTAVIPPWNFPVAIPMGGVFAALAAGSAVIIKPASATRRCVEIAHEAIMDALDAAGLPREVVSLVHLAGPDLGRHLVTHPKVDAVVLTGSIETAQTFASWRPELPLFAETSGKNAIVVTPSADIDLAVADIVRSAFGHAGQKCSAASLAIVVGSVVSSQRFFSQLRDAVRSLSVGWATAPGTQMGPLIAPASGKLLRALTELEPGEQWLVRPRQLDSSGRLWGPGVRTRVQPGSFFHLTECFGPVLGVMRAADLDEAIALQNATAFGLTGGIHTLDSGEISQWLEGVEVGNAYVNRSTTGAIVRRQPFGGWKGSAIGPGAKAGGPHYVAQFGTWSQVKATADTKEWLAAAARSDAAAVASCYGATHDPTGLEIERNVLRYRPVPRVTIRVGVGAREAEVERVRMAARTVGVPTVEVSDAATEPAAAFAARVAAGQVPGRIRLVGHSEGLHAAAASQLGVTQVLDSPVVADGWLELHTMVREQAVSMTAHRFGNPWPGLPEVPGLAG